MADNKTKLSFASYYGKYADQFYLDGEPVLDTDTYSLASYCKISVDTEKGPVTSKVKIGPTEFYEYQNKDRTKPILLGILDGNNHLIRCTKNEDGDFEVPLQNQQVQIIPSAENVAKKWGVDRTVQKVNYLNFESVWQSEYSEKAEGGASYRKPEAYTKIHLSNKQQVGPIEYYRYDEKGKAEFYGILAPNGVLTPCIRNEKGDFEFEDENHQKQTVLSGENELKKDPDKAYQVYKTYYAMNYPVYQELVKEHREKEMVSVQVQSQKEQNSSADTQSPAAATTRSSLNESVRLWPTPKCHR